MLVDRITLEYTVEYSDMLAMNYNIIRQKLHEFVCDKYEEEYNYGVEYYFEYQVVNFQDNPLNNTKRAIVNLMIYKNNELSELEKEAEERLQGGM